jgi:hypothetical protein
MKYIFSALAILTLTALVVTGCKSALYQASVQDAKDAAEANLRAYQKTPVDDGGSGAGARALDKVAYCATAQILLNEKQPLPEGGLPCPGPAK